MKIMSLILVIMACCLSSIGQCEDLNPTISDLIIQQVSSTLNIPAAKYTVADILYARSEANNYVGGANVTVVGAGENVTFPVSFSMVYDGKVVVLALDDPTAALQDSRYKEYQRESADAEDLRNAAGKGDISTVQALLAKGVDVNARGDASVRALMLASGEGHLDVVHALLAKGADVNAYNDNGWTALMYASSAGHLDVVQALLAKGADVNAEGYNSNTALSIAKAKGYSDIAQLLIEAGAR